jgi:hydroxypyruvate reductase
MSEARALLRRLFFTAVAAAHPDSCLAARLPAPPRNGRLFVLAAGKAAGSMTAAAEQYYIETLGLDPDRIIGLAVARHGYGRPTRRVSMVEAGHPIPDASGVAATERTLELAAQAGRDDLVLVLLSGGASANWTAPAPGVSLADKQVVTRALLLSGAAIGEINVVRKHLSLIKGGRLALQAQPARVVTLAISDVAGDLPTVIGSGPTVGDPSTLAEARAITEKYRIALPPSVIRALSDPENETPKPDHPVFANTEYRLVARPRDAFTAAESTVHAAGYECVMLGDHLEGDAEACAAEHARLARALQAQGRRAVILSGGELTVAVRGGGRGGPNQHYVLALALALDGAPGIAALAADTDGTDGGTGSPEDAAGAFIDPTTLARARARGLDPAAFLSDNNSTDFFARLDDLLITGPTFTNVNDFRAILVDRPRPLREMRD